MNQYIAHTRDDNDDIQTIREHDENVAELGAGFCIPAYQDIVYDSGILHDVGKYQESFQKKIQGENIRVDHSTAGAIEAENLSLIQMPASLMMAYMIAGHHAGIPDGGEPSDLPGEGMQGSSLSARLKKKDMLEDYSEYKKDGLLNDLKTINSQKVTLEILKDCDNSGEKLIDKFSFLVRYCYSCLVDADSLDTENFCQNVERETLQSDFRRCLNDVNQHFGKFICTTDLQRARSKIQGQAYERIHSAGEIYMMNMPTGSGKTLCGTKCALMKAIETGKKRIIYVIPYNSIINQTAEELTNIFGKDAQILRHQSTYSPEDDPAISEKYTIRLQQATENWDADLIITTMVQFFETTFSNKRSKLRKMHNMADSVLVFDEAHLMPLEYLQPCLQNIVYLTRYANCSAIFLTATMPAYEQLLKEYTFSDVQVVDLIPDKSLFHYFRKCHYQDIGSINDESLVNLCGNDPSALIVVNKRKTARKLYELFDGDENRLVFQLSTFQTKFDIERNIRRIKDVLTAQSTGMEKRQLIVVSTSLIEAGVDLDFYTAFREYSGLDHILQTGGRCNREGKRKEGNVYVFRLEGDKALDDIPTAVTKPLFTEYEDVSDPRCIEDYFQGVYLTYSKEITENSMHNFDGGVTNISSIPFKSYAEKMALIDDVQQSVIVPETEEAEGLVNQLQYAGVSRKIMRQLQKYMCTVPMNMFQDLQEKGVLEDYDTGAYILTNMDYYDSNTGMSTEGRDYFI